MKYNIDLIWKETIEVEAENKEKAILDAFKDYPNHHVDYISDDEGNGECVEYCEGCNRVIFETEEQYKDEHGTFCKKCSGDS